MHTQSICYAHAQRICYAHVCSARATHTCYRLIQQTLVGGAAAGTYRGTSGEIKCNTRGVQYSLYETRSVTALMRSHLVRKAHAVGDDDPEPVLGGREKRGRAREKGERAREKGERAREKGERGGRRERHTTSVPDIA
eukprot:1358353-Rhodomonas_salina.2